MFFPKHCRFKKDVINNMKDAPLTNYIRHHGNRLTLLALLNWNDFKKGTI